MPIPVAQHRLRKYLNLSSDLGGDAVAAIREGQNLLDAGPGWLHKQVLVQSLRPYTDGDATVVPLRWVASGPMTSLLPIMDANVELRAEGSASSLLTLQGSYRPPLGWVGAIVDRALLSRVAQATADFFLIRVGTCLVGPDAVAEPTSRAEGWSAAGPGPTETPRSAGEEPTAGPQWLIGPSPGTAPA